MTCPVNSFNGGQYLIKFIFFKRQKKNLFLIELPLIFAYFKSTVKPQSSE
jgi:hypothetical protein